MMRSFYFLLTISFVTFSLFSQEYGTTKEPYYFFPYRGIPKELKNIEFISLFLSEEYISKKKIRSVVFNEEGKKEVLKLFYKENGELEQLEEYSLKSDYTGLYSFDEMSPQRIKYSESRSFNPEKGVDERYLYDYIFKNKKLISYTKTKLKSNRNEVNEGSLQMTEEGHQYILINTKFDKYQSIECLLYLNDQETYNNRAKRDHIMKSIIAKSYEEISEKNELYFNVVINNGAKSFKKFSASSWYSKKYGEAYDYIKYEIRPDGKSGETTVTYDEINNRVIGRKFLCKGCKYANLTVSYRYDENGRLDKIFNEFEGGSKTISILYNEDFIKEINYEVKLDSDSKTKKFYLTYSYN